MGREQVMNKFINSIFLVLLTIAFVACKKDFYTVSEQEINDFEESLVLHRNHLLLKADGKLWFMPNDSVESTFELNVRNGDINKISLSPEGNFAAYLDSEGMVHLIETKKNATDAILPSFGDSVQQLHWMPDGRLYAFNNNGEVLVQNNAQELPHRNMDLVLTGQFPDLFHDGIYLSDSSFYFSKSRYVSPFDDPVNFGYHNHFIMYTGDNDSIPDTLNFNKFSDETIIQFLSNKEGELIAITEDENKNLSYHALTLDGSEINDVLFTKNKKFRTATGNYMNFATILDSNKILFKNDLIYKGYETIVSDKINIFEKIEYIEDFDIQMPFSEYKDVDSYLGSNDD